MNKKSTNSWLCHQLGSREHYSIPRALHETSRLGLFQTDCWVPPAASGILRTIGKSALASRYHPDLATAAVQASTPQRLLFDLQAKLGRLDAWTTMLKRNHWFQQRCLPRLRRALTDTDPKNTVVFSYSYTARDLFTEAKRQGAICVLGQIDPGPEEISWVQARCGEATGGNSPPPEYWAAWREEVELADRILANSEWSKELLVAGGVPAEKIEVLPLAYSPPTSANTLEARDYPKAFSPERPLKVLYLGQVIPRKGAAEFFAAIQNLANSPIEFHIAGPLGMPVPDSIRTNPKVRLYGPVARPKAEALYRDSDIFLLPTHSDGFAITQLEAAAHHLPIIASKNCAAVVAHDKNGLLLDEITPAAIAQAIQTCLDAPASLARWAEHDLDWSEYSLETLAERLLALGKLKSNHSCFE